MGFFSSEFVNGATTNANDTDHSDSKAENSPVLVSVSQMTELMSEMLVAMLNGDTDNIEKGKTVVARIFPDEAQRESVKKSLECLEPKFHAAVAKFDTQLTSAIETELKKEEKEAENAEQNALHQRLYGGANEPVISPAALVAKYAKRRHEKRGRLVD